LKKTILHFIHSLGRGGAETMLVTTLKELKEYNNIVVTIKNDNAFENELECDKYICLNLTVIAAFPLAIQKIKKIIRQYNVDMVHTHLFWPTVIARLAVPKKIPLLTTIHAFIATSVEYKRPDIRIIDKLTYRKRNSIIIAVAKGALEEYFNFLHLKPHKTYVLHTFVDVDRFSKKKANAEDEPFKLISVGALRIQKNQAFLIKAMSLLKDKNIELHIYGSGPLQESLQDLINKTEAKVLLNGVNSNIEEIFPLYNAFVMSSTFEGFSLAVLEAMASKIPLLLSNIDSFKEQCNDTALFFNLNEEKSLADQILFLQSKKTEQYKLSDAAFKRVNELYTLQIYMFQLRNIYIDVFTG
jgi:glycosyltransferase involved in cell wall biosynthesis